MIPLRLTPPSAGHEVAHRGDEIPSPAMSCAFAARAQGDGDLPDKTAVMTAIVPQYLVLSGSPSEIGNSAQHHVGANSRKYANADCPPPCVSAGGAGQKTRSSLPRGAPALWF
jgi:hypothetical protein